MEIQKLGGVILGLVLVGLPLTADAFMGGRENLVESSTLMGSPVKSSDGKDLGKIKQFLINPEEGEISYAVVSVGGTLGFGEKLIAIPWGDLKMGRDKEEVVFTVEKEIFEKAPKVKIGKAFDIERGAAGREKTQ